MKKLLLLSLLSFAGLANAQTGPAGCPVTQHCAALSWSDTLNPTGTTYIVWRLSSVCPSQSPATTAGFTQLNATPITTKSFIDSTVVGGTTYCYLVTAVNGSSVSGPSNDAQGAIPLLFPPQALSGPATQ